MKVSNVVYLTLGMAVGAAFHGATGAYLAIAILAVYGFTRIPGWDIIGMVLFALVGGLLGYWNATSGPGWGTLAIVTWTVAWALAGALLVFLISGVVWIRAALRLEE